ncbi:ECF transporter S component [Flexivirga meconopsidis]|uniref:ECF transporter S component n=1 Tax=Flexivirga meconopsidis TaxID=2977121 RepID=UPI00223F9912|nr:ECF transporter S component [Flexivirga meconopsidis]
MATVSAPETGRSGLRSLLAYRTIDIVTVVTLGVAIGVAFWGWGKAFAGLSTLSAFGFPPSAGLLSGPWLLGGVVGGLVVRRPGAALVTELIGANVEYLLTSQWGGGVMVSGFLQGIGAELVFLVFAYRRFGPTIAAAAGTLAAAFEVVLYEWQSYYDYWTFNYKLAYLGFFAVSGAVVAGIGGWLLVRALASTGALDAFGPGREFHDRRSV